VDPLSSQYTGTPAAQHRKELGTNIPVNEAEAQNKTYTAHRRSFPSTTVIRDKADLRNRSQNISSILPIYLHNSFHRALWRQTWKNLRYFLFSSPKIAGASFTCGCLALLSCPVPCLGTPHRNTTYFIFRALLTEQKPADNESLEDTATENKKKQREKRPKWKMILHSNLPKSHIYLCVFGIWVQTISYSFKPFFFLRCVIEKEGFFTQIKLLETVLEEGTHGYMHLFITLQIFPLGKS